MRHFGMLQQPAADGEKRRLQHRRADAGGVEVVTARKPLVLSQNYNIYNTSFLKNRDLSYLAKHLCVYNKNTAVLSQNYKKKLYSQTPLSFLRF